MAERSWFYAASGQQMGPVGEARLRELIARGLVTADTLVWAEGMAAWQKAGEVPGLLSGAVAPSAYPGPGAMAPTMELMAAALRSRSISGFGTMSGGPSWSASGPFWSFRRPGRSCGM